MQQTKEIKDLIALYVKSIETCDRELAAKLWNQTDPVSFIHPSGYEHSWQEIWDNFYKNTMNNRFSTRKLLVKNLTCSVYDTTAYVEFEWDFYAAARSDNSLVHTQGRETQFLVRQNGSWKITHIHYSALPAV